MVTKTDYWRGDRKLSLLKFLIIFVPLFPDPSFDYVVRDYLTTISDYSVYSISTCIYIYVLYLDEIMCFRVVRVRVCVLYEWKEGKDIMR